MNEIVEIMPRITIGYSDAGLLVVEYDCGTIFNATTQDGVRVCREYAFPDKGEKLSKILKEIIVKTSVGDILRTQRETK